LATLAGSVINVPEVIFGDFLFSGEIGLDHASIELPTNVYVLLSDALRRKGNPVHPARIKYVIIL
jgi:hypothetical protein